MTTMATNDPQARWLAEFLRGKKIAEVFVDHDEHNGLIRITLDVTEGTVNLVANYALGEWWAVPLSFEIEDDDTGEVYCVERVRVFAAWPVSPTPR